MSDWRIFFWAMLHSAEFKYCYILMPITARCRWNRDYPGWLWTFGIYFQEPGFYVPWTVRDAFYAVHKDVSPLGADFDDIPF